MRKEQDMDHDVWRERLALELYGEVDAHEAAEIEAHVAECGDCRRLRERLRAGLGRTSRGLAAGPALDADLRRILSGVPAAPAPRGSSGALGGPFALGLGAGLAAGVAAGVLAMLSLGPRAAVRGPDAGTVDAGFARATPPPLARAGGELAQLAAYLRR